MTLRNVTMLCAMSLLAMLPAAGCQKADQPAPGPAAAARGPIVVIETSMGTMRAELWPQYAPATVENFLRYVDEGFYDGTIFHRVIPQCIQGGGMTPDMHEKPTHDPIRNEACPQARHERGTLAMARTWQVHSATSQFFINRGNNPGWNFQDKTPDLWGYCVFGKLIDGLDVLDAIGSAATHTVGRDENVPVQPVIIRSIRREK